MLVGDKVRMTTDAIVESCQYEAKFMRGGTCLAPKIWRVVGLKPYEGVRTFEVEQIVHLFDIDYFYDRIKVKEVPGDKTYWVSEYFDLFEKSPSP